MVSLSSLAHSVKHCSQGLQKSEQCFFSCRAPLRIAASAKFTLISEKGFLGLSRLYACVGYSPGNDPSSFMELFLTFISKMIRYWFFKGPLMTELVRNLCLVAQCYQLQHCH